MKFWFGSKEETKKEEVQPMPEPAATAKPEPQPVVPPEPKPIVAPEPPPVVTPNLSMTPPPATETQSTPEVASTPPPISSPNERKALYYQMMNALYDAVLVLDGNGHVVDCNSRVESVLGYTRDDLWDARISEVVPAINAQVFHQMTNGLHGQQRVLINARCRRKDGSSFHGEIGSGLMMLVSENLVLTIRNIEKRTTPAKPQKAPVILKTRTEVSPTSNQE